MAHNSQKRFEDLDIEDFMLFDMDDMQQTATTPSAPVVNQQPTFNSSSLFNFGQQQQQQPHAFGYGIPGSSRQPRYAQATPRTFTPAESINDFDTNTSSSATPTPTSKKGKARKKANPRKKQRQGPQNSDDGAEEVEESPSPTRRPCQQTSSEPIANPPQYLIDFSSYGGANDWLIYQTEPFGVWNNDEDFDDEFVRRTGAELKSLCLATLIPGAEFFEGRRLIPALRTEGNEGPWWNAYAYVVLD
ncbi:hypothetical protein EJ08DRAFT_699520 [Tothia fuscella]|uniref:Uncharacterized protein n=1 Tax=Tothia fuscella TaxID=1048955 RepID=A0A9P4TWF6_9PEZI|nr:hypothetical protein EJ08DRAFT_699520 [Tothia fuscella]